MATKFLFTKYDIYDVGRLRKKQLKNAYQNLPDDESLIRLIDFISLISMISG